VSCTMSIKRSYGLFLVNSSPNQMLSNCISYNPITHSRVSTQNKSFDSLQSHLKNVAKKIQPKKKREQRFHELRAKMKHELSWFLKTHQMTRSCAFSKLRISTLTVC
jgi:hypothetical protein